TKSNQVQSRQKQLDKLERLEVEEEDVHAMNIRFPPAPRSGQVVVEAKDAGHSFGAKHVFSGANFNVERGQKIALVGRNGEGKTTFVRAMLHEITPTQGEVKMGYNVHVGYFAQNQDDLMDGDFTVYDTLDRVAVGDIRTKLRDILGAFLFRGEDIDKKVKVLSGGERSRLAMARLMLEPYNLLVLDEPTNHMDMLSKEILKLALQRYDGTVIVISHDREFLDGLVDTVYEFRDGKVKEYLGGIYDFITARKIENISDIERKNAAPTPAPEKKEATPASPSAPKHNAPKPKKPKNAFKIKELEAQIEELEAAVKVLDKKLADPGQYSVELFNEWDTTKKELDSKLEAWTLESEAE
ncbi:MAG: ATP-binding cassette domain-containing protein, partial [Mucinivorans sp.]